MSSFIQRNYLNSTLNYPVRTLTIGAELDGLCRISRIAENYYKQVEPCFLLG